MAVIKVTKDNFEQEVMQADQPVLVDFWAEWCGPCRMLSPILDQLAEEDSSIKCCKVNVEEEPDLAARFNVINIPCVFAIKNGSVVTSAVGIQTKQALKEMLN